MPTLKYDDFIKEATARGFVSQYIDRDFPPCQFGEDDYYCCDPDIDHHLYGVRASQEGKFVYGKYVKGCNSLISIDWFKIYYNAFCPDKTVEERSETGLSSNEELKIYQFLKQEKRNIPYSDIRKMLNYRSDKNSIIESALANLQLTCDVIMAGNLAPLSEMYPNREDTQDKFGEGKSYIIREVPFPDSFFENTTIERTEAQNMIFNQMIKINNEFDMKKARSLFVKQLKILDMYKKDTLSNYNLSEIRQKLSEAEIEANNSTISRKNIDDIMNKYQEMYGYEV